MKASKIICVLQTQKWMIRTHLERNDTFFSSEKFPKVHCDHLDEAHINISCNDSMENIELSLCVITTFQISYVGDYHLYMTNFCLSSLQYPIA